MKNQKELSIRQIKNVFKKASKLMGEKLEQTTDQVLELLKDEQGKELAYKVYKAYQVRTRLLAQIKRQQVAL